MALGSRYVRRRCLNVLCLTLSMLAMGFGLCWLGWLLFTLLKYGVRGVSV